MKIDRNALCYCGSGKKYKKCCMEKDQQKQANQMQLDRYNQLKKQLQFKLHHFLEQDMTLHEINQLKTELKSRLNIQSSSQQFDAIFNEWLTYYRRDEQGKRVCELFLEQQGGKLSYNEHELIKQWISAKPQLIQAKEISDEGLLTVNILTKEHHLLQHVDNLSTLLPWSISLCRVIHYEGDLFLGGPVIWEEPIHLLTLKELLLERTKNQTDIDAISDLYPELMGTILSEHNDRSSEHQFSEVTLKYKLDDIESVVSSFLNRENFVVEKWEANNKVLNWIDDWYRYEDNMISAPIDIGHAYGGVTFSDNVLTFKSFFEEKVTQFQTWMDKQPSSNELIEKTTQSVMSQNDIQSLVVKIDSNIPKAFALYAQSRLILSDFNKPLPLLNRMSLTTLAAEQRFEEIDIWLQEQEYMSRLNSFQQFGYVDITEDFNWVREQFGLPKSHFVSEYNKRKTMLNPCPKYNQFNHGE